MPYIKLNGDIIFYILHKAYIAGAINQPVKSLVLIHGAGGNHLSMLSVFNYIKKKYGGTFNILVFDLPGHFRSQFLSAGGINLPGFGDEAMPHKTYTDGIAYYAETVNALYSRLLEKTGAVILIGHSMGAQVCIKYASLFPPGVEKAMLIAGCHDTYISDSFIRSMESSFDRTITLFLRDALASKDKNLLNNALTDIKRTPPPVVINDFKYIKYFSGHYGGDISEINSGKVFFNLIYSKNDLIINDECMAELHKKLVNSIIREIPAKSHMDFLYENPSMEKEIDKFLLT